jgi:hypothetical protein
MSWFFGGAATNKSGASPSKSGRHAGSGNGAGRHQKRAPVVYDLHRLQFLYADLAELTWFEKSANIRITSVNRQQVVEILRAISELIVYGAQGPDGERIFDYFCEKNFLHIFTRMLAARPGCGDVVKRQIIQTMSILVQNISNDTYFYYLLSNNHINEIIAHPFDLANEDVLAHFVSFLKMLSLKLNVDTVQFFFNAATNTFPLFTEASKLIVHPENMVRTHIRNLTLNVFKVAAGEPTVAEYLTRTGDDGAPPAAADVLNKLAFWLRDQSNILGRFLQLPEGGTGGAGGSPPRRKHEHHLDRIKEMTGDVVDEVYYLQDVFSTGIAGVQICLSDAMLENVYFPVLIDGLRNIHSNSGAPPDDSLWGPDCCVDSLAQQSPHGRGPMGSLLAMYLLTQSLLVLDSKRLTSAIAEAIIGHDPVRIEDWIVGLRDHVVPTQKGHAASKIATSSWQAPPPLRPGRGHAVDYAGGRECKNPIRRALFGHICSGDDRHLLMAVCFIHALLSNDHVNPSVVRRGQFAPARTRQKRSLFRELVEDSSEGGSGDEQSLFRDMRTPSPGTKHDKLVAGVASLSLFSTTSEDLEDSAAHEARNAVVGNVVSFLIDRTIESTDPTTIVLEVINRVVAESIGAVKETAEDVAHRIVGFLVDQAVEQVDPTAIVHDILDHAWADHVLSTPVAPAAPPPPAALPLEKTPLDAMAEYPVQLVGALLSAALKVAQKHAGHARILTFRSIVSLLQSLVDKGIPSGGGNEAPSVTSLGPRLLAKHTAAVRDVLVHLRSGLAAVLQEKGTLQRQKDFFTELFEAEMRHSETASTLPLDLLAGRSSLLLPISRGPKSGVELDSRLPMGEAEHVRWCLRAIFVFRAFLYWSLGEVDVELEALKDICFDQDGRADGGGEAPIDFRQVEHIACRLPPDSGNATMRDVFLVIQGTLVSLAEPVVRPSATPLVMPCILTPLRVLESVSVDHHDPRVLRITFRSQASNVNGARRGSFGVKTSPKPRAQGKEFGSNESNQYHLTCAFENLSACRWAREKLEGSTLYYRAAKMKGITEFLRLDDVPQMPPSPEEVESSGADEVTSFPDEEVLRGVVVGAPSPTKKNALQQLRNMGFTQDDGALKELLERHHGSVEASVDELLHG